MQHRKSNPARTFACNLKLCNGIKSASSCNDDYCASLVRHGYHLIRSTLEKRRMTVAAQKQIHRVLRLQLGIEDDLYEPIFLVEVLVHGILLPVFKNHLEF